eukprot:5744348-Amphidinium_carterae.1
MAGVRHDITYQKSVVLRNDLLVSFTQPRTGKHGSQGKKWHFGVKLALVEDQVKKITAKMQAKLGVEEIKLVTR